MLHQMFPSDSSAVEAPYTWRDALRWLQQIAGALKYLHGLRPMVVHRDLKLENLLLTCNNPARADAKLADFGLCKLIKVSWHGAWLHQVTLPARQCYLCTAHKPQPTELAADPLAGWLAGGLPQAAVSSLNPLSHVQHTGLSSSAAGSRQCYKG